MLFLFVTLAITTSGCATIREMEEVKQKSFSVQITANPQTVAACQRVGGVAVADYTQNEFQGGPHRVSDIPAWLRVQAVYFGGDTVLMSGTGKGTVGDIYRCK